ncbi:MAG: hypothetical protein J0H65_01590 [Rhizobiales bacterium]|nr:hypothetical protein [Hyphomicrobiales bacterium]
MEYRGDDLDLRTPHAAPGDVAAFQPAEPLVTTSRMRAASSSARNPGPIWVDEILLDCCNHAYDIASAHRATEVHLEHLIYALTRIDAAVDELEAHGVRVAGLRREAATVVATEIPAAHGSGKTNPRRAEIVENVLRTAAAHAYRRQSAAGVADVIFALLDSGLEYSTLLRLLPATPRPVEAVLETSAPRGRTRNGSAPSQPAPGFAGDVALTSQQSRIDAVEQSLRALTLELANERKILSGVLQDLQRELMAQREDTSRLGGLTQDKIQSVFGDRLHSLEQAFLSGRGANGESQDLQDRLGLLESALQGEISATRAAVETLAGKPGPDLSPLLLRLETLEAAGQTLSATVDHLPAETAALATQPVIEHLNTLTVKRDAQHAAAADGIADTNRRLAALEETLNNHAADAARERAELRLLLERLTERHQENIVALTESITQDMSEVHDGLSRIHSDHHTLATTIDTEAQGAATAFATLAARIESLEQAAIRPIEMLETLSATVDKMHKVTVEKYYRRNRFWYWLFGTDDWLAASWPSQSARIEEELRAVRR